MNVNSISDAPVCSSQMVDQLIGVTADENISINCRVSWKKSWPCRLKNSTKLLKNAIACWIK